MFDKSSEEMNSNVFKITKEKLLSIANNATKKDTSSSRPTNNRGYHRLKSTWIPRSCQTMKDHPTQLNFSYWNREDMSLLKNWMADKPVNFVDQSQTNPEVDWTTDGTSNPEVNFANWSANDTNPEGNFANWTTNDINPEANFANWDDNEEEDEEEDDITYDDFYSNINKRQIEEVDIQQVRTIENWLQGKPHSDSVYSLESSDNDDSFPQDDNNLPTNDTNNNGYKTDPVIVMNDDFIEIHFDSETALQQAQESFNKLDSKISRCIPRNRNNHHVEIQSSKIIKTNGLSPRHPPLYKNFLEKDDGGSSSDNAQSSDSCNSLDNQVIDDWEESVRQSCYNEHRQLRQYLPKVEDAQRASQGHQASQGHKTPNAFKRIGSCKIKSEDLSASFAESKRELKNFLSFRKPKKKNQCKNRVVVGEEGVAGPIWPAVLLTFDRGISPTPDSQPNQLSPSSC